MPAKVQFIFCFLKMNDKYSQYSVRISFFTTVEGQRGLDLLRSSYKVAAFKKYPDIWLISSVHLSLNFTTSDASYLNVSSCSWRTIRGK